MFRLTCWLLIKLHYWIVLHMHCIAQIKWNSNCFIWLICMLVWLLFVYGSEWSNLELKVTVIYITIGWWIWYYCPPSWRHHPGGEFGFVKVWCTDFDAQCSKAWDRLALGSSQYRLGRRVSDSVLWILVLGDLCIGGITQGVMCLDGRFDLNGFPGMKWNQTFN